MDENENGGIGKGISYILPIGFDPRIEDTQSKNAREFTSTAEPSDDSLLSLVSSFASPSALEASSEVAAPLSSVDDDGVPFIVSSVSVNKASV